MDAFVVLCLDRVYISSGSVMVTEFLQDVFVSLDKCNVFL